MHVIRPVVLFVFVRTLAGSTDVRIYRQRVSRRYRNRNMIKCEFGASEVNCWALMELSFVDICIFQAISGADWSKHVFKPMNINFAFKALRKLAIFWYGGFEYETLGLAVMAWPSWLPVATRNRQRGGRMQETRETNSDETTTVQERTCQHQRSSTHGALLFEKVLWGLWSRTTWADVNKIKAF